MKQLWKNTDEGMTLIETVLYIALFGIIFYSMMQFTMAVSENNHVARSRNEVYRGMLFVTEHMKEEFETVDAIDVANSVLDSDDGVLALQVGGVTSVEYRISSGRLLYTDSGMPNFITPPELHLDVFRLQRIDDKFGNIIGVRVEITLSSEKYETTTSVVTSYVL